MVGFETVLPRTSMRYANGGSVESLPAEERRKSLLARQIDTVLADLQSVGSITTGQHVQVGR